MSAEMPLFWFWLPVLDCMRLMIGRALKHKSPLEGDRNHFHHVLQSEWGSHKALAVYLALLAAPGAAAEFNILAGGITLLWCIGLYIAIMARGSAASKNAQLENAFRLAPTHPRYVARLGHRTANTSAAAAHEINPAAGA
jgi:hypothetical protein